jgi:hypothetical protein
MATRDELVAAVKKRYGNGDRKEKTRISDAFVAVIGFHRKHAMRVLRSGQPPYQRARLQRRVYDVNVREALLLLWEASDRRVPAPASLLSCRLHPARSRGPAA